MKIALIAPLAERVPPVRYGGTERVVADLANELVSLGKDVTVFASGNSNTNAKLVSGRDLCFREDSAHNRHDVAAYLLMLKMVCERSTEYDVINFHTDAIHLGCLNQISTPTLTTLHTQPGINDALKLYESFPDHPLVALSASHQRCLPYRLWTGIVNNGIPSKRFRLSTRSSGYLVFLGRLSPDKGAHIAINVAIRANIPLIIAARLDVNNMAYFESQIKPHFDHDLINFIGEIDESQKRTLLRGANALLFPILWDEPFGLVIIEAMACGTPTIGFAKGAVDEIIEDGVTGFVVRNENEMIQSLTACAMLDRAAVRQVFDDKFTARNMALNYIKIYENLILKKNYHSLQDKE